MKHFLKIVPIPICGLILGLTSLGNLLKDYHLTHVGNFVGAIGMLLMLLIIGKLILLFEHTKQHLYDPIVASVSPTFTMSLMVICTYFVSFKSIAPIVKLIWLAAVIFQIILVLYFNYHHVVKADLSIEAIFPSWFIVYVGFGVITVTAGNFSPILGKIFFWLSLACYVVLLPIIIHRIFFVKNMAQPTLPLIAILAAPGSLCLTGYLKNFEDANLALVMTLFLVSQVLYFIVLAMLPRLLLLDFYPSFAAFTFPLVISATAISTATAYFHQLGFATGILDGLKVIECLIACGMIAYVLGHYAIYLIKEHSQHKHHLSKGLIE